MSAPNDDWEEMLEKSAASFRAHCERRARRGESLRSLERKVNTKAERRRAILLDKAAESMGRDLAAMQAEHEKGRKVRERERAKVVKGLWEDMPVMESVRRPMQATIGRLRNAYAVAAPFSAAANPSLSCVVRPRRSYEETVHDSGPTTSHQTTFLNQKLLIRTEVDAADSSTIQFESGWVFGWEALRAGYAKVGSSHVLAGVIEASCGESCWPITPFGAGAQVSLTTSLEVWRDGSVLYPFELLGTQYQFVDGANAQEGQTRVTDVYGTYDLTHKGVPVLEGDRVLARIGVNYLASTLGDSDAKCDFHSNKKAGDELICAWMLVDTVPG